MDYASMRSSSATFLMYPFVPCPSNSGLLIYASMFIF